MLAVGISWASWKPVALGDSPPLLLLLVFLGSFGPSLAASCSQPLTRESPGSKSCSARSSRGASASDGTWSCCSVRWLDGMLEGSGLGLGGLQILEGLPTCLILLGLLPAFLISLIFGGPLGEEIGWWGYVQPGFRRNEAPSAPP